ncbi:MAG TPA: M56 family metallopeptidase, partial [Brevundimonas sp.]|nr:M56 family metallopeptidase [Brevundimonas sp.]
MTDWLFQALLGSTILGAVVVLVRPWVLRRLGPRMAYGLWLLPVVRLVLPPMPAWSVHSSAVASLGEDAAGVATLIAPQSLRLDAFVQIVVVLWAVGALIHLGRGLFDYVRFMQRAGAA